MTRWVVVVGGGVGVITAIARDFVLSPDGDRITLQLQAHLRSTRYTGRTQIAGAHPRILSLSFVHPRTSASSASHSSACFSTTLDARGALALLSLTRVVCQFMSASVVSPL